jgi:hypothetical protein
MTDQPKPEGMPYEMGPKTFSGDVRAERGISTFRLNLQPTEATISSGAIDFKSSYMKIQTEGAASTDDLDTINGGTDGDILVLVEGTSGDTVVVRDGQDNIHTNGDRTLDDQNHCLVLMKRLDSTGSEHWIEVSFGLAT